MTATPEPQDRPYRRPPAGAVPPPPPPRHGPPPAGPAGPPLSPSDQQLWAVLAHLGTLPVWFVAPLVVWLVLRGRGAFLEEHAKESLNFQLTVALAGLALSSLTVATLGLGGLLVVPFAIAVLVLVVVAAVRASQGRPFRYPLTLRLVA